MEALFGALLRTVFIIIVSVHALIFFSEFRSTASTLKTTNDFETVPYSPSKTDQSAAGMWPLVALVLNVSCTIGQPP